LCEGDTRNRWRDGQVCPDVGQGTYGALGQTARVCFGVLCANRTREVKRDFCDLPIRRNEGRVVNTPLVFKRVLFQEERKEGQERNERKKKTGNREERERKKKSRARERGAGLGERKRLSPGLEWKDDERRWR
ncbi:hypothetical protein TNCV_4002931, partial [Trichonephila clavipes]